MEPSCVGPAEQEEVERVARDAGAVTTPSQENGAGPARRRGALGCFGQAARPLAGPGGAGAWWV